MITFLIIIFVLFGGFALLRNIFSFILTVAFVLIIVMYVKCSDRNFSEDSYSMQESVTYMYVTANSLNIRSSPSAIDNSNIIGSLQKNSRVEVIMYNSNDWIKIKYGNTKGWVSLKYLAEKHRR